MNAVLHITFWDEGRSASVFTYGFYVDNLTAPWDAIEDHLSKCATQLKDFCGAPKFVKKNWPDHSFGFVFDVKKDSHQEVMRVFHQMCVQAWPNSNVGEVCSLDTVRPQEFLQFTEQAYNQQQANLLRDRLNTHVSVVQLVGQPKKM